MKKRGIGLDGWRLEQNRNSRAQAKILQSGFYSHPKDKDLSLGAPGEEKAAQRACHWVQLFWFCCSCQNSL